MEKIQNHFGSDFILKSETEGSYPYIVIEKSGLKDLVVFLANNEACFFDYLSCITAVDYLEEAEIELIYELRSIPYEKNLTVKTRLSREHPEIESLSSIWHAANWHEREAFDLFGINFTNHPNLRRILMPSNWNGFPLRKDYQEEETYFGVKIKY